MSIKAKSLQYLNKWRQSSNKSINRQIFVATIVVGLLTGFGKFASVGKELVVAWRFGTGNELDAFLIALVVPAFIVNVVAGSFKSALIPEYIKVREQQGSEAAQRLFSGIAVWALGLLIVTAVLMVLFTPLFLPVLASGFSEEKLRLTTRLLWTLSPQILIYGVINVWGGVLNAGEKFALAAFTPVLIPFTTVVLLFALPNLGIYALAVGVICGSFLEMIVLAIGLHQQQVSFIPKWSGYDANIKQLVGQYLPVVTGAFLMCSTSLVDQSMAAMLDSGSVAALGYANRIIALPLTLATLALGTAVVPYFSKTIAQKDWRKINHTFNYYLKLIFYTTIPLAIALILGSKLIVKLLFERGSFNAEDTQLVSQIQLCYALQIPFYVSAIFVVRLVNSLGVNHFLAWGAGINLLANIVLNYVFVRSIGIKGIALSTSCVYLISFTFLYILTKKHLEKISLKNT